MSILLGVIALFAILTLTIAVQQGMAIARLAPAQERLASFFPFGWWKFGALERKAGPSSAQHLLIYKRAVIAFLVLIVFGLVLSGWTVNRGQSALATATFSSDLPRLEQVALTNQLPARRVATMPGAPSLES